MTKFKISGLSMKDIISMHFGHKKTVFFNKEQDQILETLTNQDSENIYFFDSRGAKIKQWVNMYDITKRGPVPLYTKIYCETCRNSFYTHPLGCPIKYCRADEKSQHRQVMKEFIEKNNINSEEFDYFETEKIFCSWPCMKRYILVKLSQNPYSSKYKESLSLMTLMFTKVTGQKSLIIPVANDHSLLEDYGGTWTIEKYRKSFEKVFLYETINTVRPLMFSSSSTYIKI